MERKISRKNLIKSTLPVAAFTFGGFKIWDKFLDGTFKNPCEMNLDNNNKIFGLKTHFEELDNFTGGLKPGEIILIGSRPGRGKTSLALNIATKVALQEGKAVGIFSMEMSPTEAYTKMICAHSRLDMERFRNDLLKSSERKQLKEAAMKIHSSQILIDDHNSKHVSDFLQNVELMKDIQPLSLIIVDYLQLMSSLGLADRQEELSAIMSALKQAAKIADCPVIVFSQISRSNSESLGKQRPKLADLRINSLELYSDIVLFLHREDMILPEDEVTRDIRNKAEIIVAKNRFGKTGSFFLKFTPEYGRFDSIT